VLEAHFFGIVLRELGRGAHSHPAPPACGAEVPAVHRDHDQCAEGTSRSTAMYRYNGQMNLITEAAGEGGAPGSAKDLA
jgi:hypothetical protein